MDTPQTPAPTVKGVKHKSASVAGPRPKPAGWWSIDAASKCPKGIKTDVLNAVANDQTIPAHWRQAITTEIGQQTANAVEVHAHSQIDSGEMVFSIHIKPLF